jgi:cytoskeletal protein RodZ
VVGRSTEASRSTCNSSRRMTRSKVPRQLPGEALDQEHRTGLLHRIIRVVVGKRGPVSMSVRFKNLREDRAQHVSAQLLARSPTPSTASPRRSTRTSGSQPSTSSASASSQPPTPTRPPVGARAREDRNWRATRATRTTTEGARTHVKRRRTTRGPRAPGGTGRRCGDHARADGKEAAKRARMSVKTIRRAYMPYYRPRGRRSS